MLFIEIDKFNKGKLFPGEVTDEQFNCLIDISSVRSNKVINALHDYFVDGSKRSDICKKHHVNPGYLSIKIREINFLFAKIIASYFSFANIQN